MTSPDDMTAQLEWLRDESLRTGHHRRQSVAVRALADLAALRAEVAELRNQLEAARICGGCVTDAPPVDNGRGELIHPDMGYCMAADYWTALSPAPRTETREEGEDE